MAIYKPDYKYIKGKKLLDTLAPVEKTCTLTQEECSDIKYYVDRKDKHILKLQKQILEYQEVFTAIGKFIPKGDKVLG